MTLSKQQKAFGRYVFGEGLKEFAKSITVENFGKTMAMHIGNAAPLNKGGKELRQNKDEMIAALNAARTVAKTEVEDPRREDKELADATACNFVNAKASDGKTFWAKLYAAGHKYPQAHVSQLIEERW